MFNPGARLYIYITSHTGKGFEIKFWRWPHPKISRNWLRSPVSHIKKKCEVRLRCRSRCLHFVPCGSSLTSAVGWRNAENMRHHALSLCDYLRKPEHPWGAGSARGQFPGRGVLHDLRDGLRHQLHEHSSTCRQGLWFFFFFLPLTHSNPNASHGEPNCKFLFVCLFVLNSPIVINLINPRFCPFFTYGLN